MIETIKYNSKIICISIAILIIVALGLSVFTGCRNTTQEFDSTKDIDVISREEGSGTKGAFSELFELIQVQKADNINDANVANTVKSSKIILQKDLTTKDASVENSTNTIMTTVENDPYAIGYISMGSMNDKVKPIEIDGIAPTPENVKNGSYKISRPFIITYKSQISPLAEDFIGFILSKEGQKIANETYIEVDANADRYAGNMPSGSIVIGGSSSVSPLMETLIDAYKSINPQAKLQLQITDSTTGIAKTSEGTYDIGMSSRDLKESEKGETPDANIGDHDNDNNNNNALIETKIALDGITLIVNKSNPIDNLSKDAVRDIYIGKFKTWNDVNVTIRNLSENKSE
ncbi:MAG: substrate-binding domain-containing protein [Clostridiales Family XIII bacterium]|jgi:phosphate transport system substrate-binding protein|nr:substrate-binding domain-containing protein [Clostridiales Family XIII bacterium]